MRDIAGSAAAPAARRRKFRRGRFIFEPPSRFTSLDHLVDAANHRQRDGEGERLGGLHVDNELDFGRLLDRQLGGLLAFENSACIDAERVVRIQNGASVSHEAASGYKLAKLVD